jgi:predicted ATPase
VDELLTWLKVQHNGLRTYKNFQQRVLNLSGSDREHVALYQILGLLVGRFIDSYEEHPLTGDVADQAFDHLIEITEKAAKSLRAAPAEQLATLNAIAAADLG